MSGAITDYRNCRVQNINDSGLRACLDVEMRLIFGDFSGDALIGPALMVLRREIIFGVFRQGSPESLFVWMRNSNPTYVRRHQKGADFLYDHSEESTFLLFSGHYANYRFNRKIKYHSKEDRWKKIYEGLNCQIPPSYDTIQSFIAEHWHSTALKVVAGTQGDILICMGNPSLGFSLNRNLKITKLGFWNGANDPNPELVGPGLKYLDSTKNCQVEEGVYEETSAHTKQVYQFPRPTECAKNLYRYFIKSIYFQNDFLSLPGIDDLDIFLEGAKDYDQHNTTFQHFQTNPIEHIYSTSSNESRGQDSSESIQKSIRDVAAERRRPPKHQFFHQNELQLNPTMRSEPKIREEAKRLYGQREPDQQLLTTPLFSEKKSHKQRSPSPRPSLISERQNSRRKQRSPNKIEKRDYFKKMNSSGTYSDHRNPLNRLTQTYNPERGSESFSSDIQFRYQNQGIYQKFTESVPNEKNWVQRHTAILQEGGTPRKKQRQFRYS